ncbi:hypothetical protein [Lactococcus allomyrinae]|uniref:Uncharacterized protein n=1 Tax=Lactococcus allomyrinae TaxID=2419773 RepID=A0A387BAT7_9LACT|nr:hypothetical protein [Lactococcus allomyrinae]AYG00985.1 hypothetical protein D7I46_07730 [Lactococcus allomyrinae]
MQKDGKNKFKDNIWFRQGVLIFLILVWVVAILFRNQMSMGIRIIVMVVLLAFSIATVYWINRAFFGIGKKKK